MKIPREELSSILVQLNPWWRSEKIPYLPSWHRGVFSELMEWIDSPPANRAVLLAGPRQVGKTTLLFQAIQQLLSSEVPASNILYVTFNHPICKLAGMDAVIEAWRGLEPKTDGLEYLFLDDTQTVRDMGTWVKHSVDFFKKKRIIFTRSATPPIHADQESGVGRWHNISLSTLSFYEYLQIRNVKLPEIPTISSLKSLALLNDKSRDTVTQAGTALIGHFHEYLIRGGFPQAALAGSATQSQKLLREDIVEKILKSDMSSLFGVRKILELEQMFVFLCLRDGGIQDTQKISRTLGIAKQTVQSFIDLFESVYLIHKLPPFGYGKEVLRGKDKIYLSDPVISASVLIRGRTILENPRLLSKCVETAMVGHPRSHCRNRSAHFSYWRDSKNKLVDLVVEIDGAVIPFEVRYQYEAIQKRDIAGLTKLAEGKPVITCCYAVTKSPNDIGLMEGSKEKMYMKIPAALLCYCLSESEFRQSNILL